MEAVYYLKRVKKTLYTRFRKIRAFFLRKTLNSTDFTIISNNCWAGYVYRRYNLPYNSPTIGLYFFPDHYLKFIKNLKYYLNYPLVFISSAESAYAKTLHEKGEGSAIIGRLDDLEIVFLHYKTKEEAHEKWNRRTKRVNYDNMIFKFSQQNRCQEMHLKDFESLPFKKKFMFVSDPASSYSCAIYYKGYDETVEIKNDTAHYARDLSIRNLINQSADDFSLEKVRRL